MTIPYIPKGYFCLGSFRGRALKYPSVELVVNVLAGYSSQNMILHVKGNTDGGLDVRKGNFLFYLGKILSLNSRTCSDLAS